MKMFALTALGNFLFTQIDKVTKFLYLKQKLFSNENLWWVSNNGCIDFKGPIPVEYTVLLHCHKGYQRSGLIVVSGCFINIIFCRHVSCILTVVVLLFTYISVSVIDSNRGVSLQYTKLMIIFGFPKLNLPLIFKLCPYIYILHITIFCR